MSERPGQAERGPSPVVVIAGASGFLGQVLTARLADQWEVRRIGRSGADADWSDERRIVDLVDGAALLVNLAGKSVGCRYTDANRREIYRSRVATTELLHRAVERSTSPPPVWLNASTATIYRHETERPNTESAGVLGTGFSVDVARAWERALFAGDLPATRRVALRMAIVIGDGGALPMLARAVRLGLGGTQYDGWCPPHHRYRGIGPDATGADWPGYHRTHGHQRFSWIHVDDVVAAIHHIVATPTIDGPVNLAVPEASDNAALMAGLRHALGRRFGLPAVRWMLEIGTLVLRQETELILKSRWVAPEVLLDTGFTFAHPDLEPALRDGLAAR